MILQYYTGTSQLIDPLLLKSYNTHIQNTIMNTIEQPTKQSNNIILSYIYKIVTDNCCFIIIFIITIILLYLRYYEVKKKNY